MKNFSVQGFGYFLTILVMLSGAPALALQAGDTSPALMRHEYQPVVVKIEGVLSCARGEQGQECKIKDTRSGKTFAVQQSDELSALFNAGKKKVALEGQIFDSGTFQMAHVTDSGE